MILNWKVKKMFNGHLDQNFNKESILIIGGTGFIGSKFYEMIIRKGYSVDVLGLPVDYKLPFENYYAINIFNSEELENFFKKKQYTNIFHLAALIDVNESLLKPKKYYEINSFGTLNILEAIRKYQKHAKLIFNSTGLVYGNTDCFPITEKNTIKPNTPYAFSKYIAEEIIKSYSINYNIKAIIFRLFTVYGPGQKSNMFIPSFIKRCLNEREITIGNTNVTRDYIYITDVLSLLEKTLNKKIKNFDIYNVASGEEYKILEIAKLILKYTNRDISEVKVKSDLKRSSQNEIHRICVNIEKVRNEFNWKPSVSLEQGIKETIDAFITINDNST